MAILSDFIHIIGNKAIRIGNGSYESGYSGAFDTIGHIKNYTAYITCMVQGMTHTRQHAEIYVNQRKVGVLFNNAGGNPNHWQSQMISLASWTLQDRNNLLWIRPVRCSLDRKNRLDDFSVRNLICHYQQI